MLGLMFKAKLQYDPLFDNGEWVLPSSRLQLVPPLS